MALLDMGFDVNELPVADSDYAPIQDGWYRANISIADIKATKDGTGQYINLTYDIVAPTNAGRKVFGMINVRNKSSKAEEIGRQQLGSLMRAIGLAKVNDTDELLGATLEIKVATEKSEGYEPRNVVKGYKAVEGVTNVTAPTTTADAPKSAAPWSKK